MTETPETRVSATALALHFACSRQNVAHLVTAGVIVRGADGLFDQDKSRRQYFEHLRVTLRHSPKNDADAELARQKARKIANENAAYEGAHMMTAEALECVEKLVGGVLLVELSNLPAAIAGRDLQLRRKVEAAVYTIREKIATTAEEFAKKWKPP